MTDINVSVFPPSQLCSQKKVYRVKMALVYEALDSHALLNDKTVFSITGGDSQDQRVKKAKDIRKAVEDWAVGYFPTSFDMNTTCHIDKSSEGKVDLVVRIIKKKVRKSKISKPFDSFEENPCQFL